MLPCLVTTSTGTLLHLKIVPGASRSRIAGLLGERLKVQIAAPPEGGKANAALGKLLAETFGLAPRQVTVIDGQTRPQKTVLLQDINAAAVETKLRELGWV